MGDPLKGGFSMMYILFKQYRKQGNIAPEQTPILPGYIFFESNVESMRISRSFENNPKDYSYPLTGMIIRYITKTV
jgi:hypothetical protein